MAGSNLVQIFQLVTDVMELYYKICLLSVAHNRFDHYIAVMYASVIPANKINKQSDSQSLFVVASKSDPMFSIQLAWTFVPACVYKV